MLNNKIYIVLLVILLFIVGFFLIRNYKSQIEILNNELEILEDSNNELKKELEIYRKRLEKSEKLSTSCLLHPSDVLYFQKEYGIENPDEFIKEKLRNRKDLIPFEGVLGGEMYFANICILNHSWIYAYVEDGHVGGYLFIEYSIKDDGEIEWRIIDSAELDGR